MNRAAIFLIFFLFFSGAFIRPVFGCGCVDPASGMAASQQMNRNYDVADAAMASIAKQIGALITQQYTIEDHNSYLVESIGRVDYRNTLILKSAIENQHIQNALKEVLINLSVFRQKSGLEKSLD